MKYFFKNRKGQAAIESAYVLPLFVFLILATIDLPITTYFSLHALSSAHEGVREASINTVQSGARKGTEYLKAGIFSHYGPVKTVQCATGGSFIGSSVICTATVVYKPLSPLVAAFKNPITITRYSTGVREKL